MTPDPPADHESHPPQSDPQGDLDLSPEEALLWETDPGETPGSLVDLVNRLLDKGVVITGDVTISVAGVDLVYLGLNAILTSVATAREHLRREIGPTRED